MIWFFIFNICAVLLIWIRLGYPKYIRYKDLYFTEHEALTGLDYVYKKGKNVKNNNLIESYKLKKVFLNFYTIERHSYMFEETLIPLNTLFEKELICG